MSFYFKVVLNSSNGGIGEGDGAMVIFMVQEQKVMGSMQTLLLKTNVYLRFCADTE